MKGRNPRFIKDAMLFCVVITFERVGFSMYSSAKERAPRREGGRTTVTRARRRQEQFQHHLRVKKEGERRTKRDMVIWSRMIRGSTTLALFIAKPKTMPARRHMT